MKLFNREVPARKTALCTLVALILLFIDQFTKMVAHYFLEYTATYATHTISVIPGFLSFTYTGNQGIAFGLGMENQAFMIAVMVLTAVLIFLIIFLVYAVFRGNLPVRMTLAVIEAGAIGNFIDRLCFAEDGVATVRDFLDFSAFRPLHWLGSDFNFGICNFADLCISFGAVALVFIILFIGPRAVFPLKKKWREEAKREEEEEGKKREKREENIVEESAPSESAPNESMPSGAPAETPGPLPPEEGQNRDGA